MMGPAGNPPQGGDPPDLRAAAPEQLVFDLPHLASFGLEDFLISRSNAAAAAVVEGWPEWPNAAVAILGPPGSGKSHLAQAWQARSGAGAVQAAGIDESVIARFEETSALVVEDIDRGISDERVLFHILNLAREKRGSVLVTTTRAPGELDIALADLRSRLRALPLAVIEPPDEALLQAVLVKLFADRQIAVEPQVISYMTLHLDRSLEAARRAVAAADTLSLARQRKITRALAAQALAAAGRPEPHAP
jgi:chromosomal replication initiation ATPase DnaA